MSIYLDLYVIKYLMRFGDKMIDLYKKHKEIINYLFFGALTTLVSLLVYYLLTLTILNPDDNLKLQIANIISWCAGVSFAYVTNRKFVFSCTNQNVWQEVITFTSARITTLLLDMLIMFIFVSLLKFDDKLIKLISQVLVVICNYLLSKLVVFKE